MPEHPVRKGSQGPGHQGEAHHTEGLQPGPLLGPVLSYLPGLLLASGQGAVWVPEVVAERLAWVSFPGHIPGI